MVRWWPRFLLGYGLVCIVFGAGWLVLLQTEARTVEARQSLTAVAAFILVLGLFLAVRFSPERLKLSFKAKARPHYLRYLKFAKRFRSRARLLWMLRAEALTVLLFTLLLQVDQSAEAIRIMADPADPVGQRFALFAVWLFFCACLCFVLESSCCLTLQRAGVSTGTDGFDESSCLMRASYVATLSALALGAAAFALFSAAEPWSTMGRKQLNALDVGLYIAGVVFVGATAVLRAGFVAVRRKECVPKSNGATVLGPLVFGTGWFAKRRKAPEPKTDVGLELQRGTSKRPRELLRSGRSWGLLVAFVATGSTFGVFWMDAAEVGLGRGFLVPAPILITAWAMSFVACLAWIIDLGRRWHFPLITLLIGFAFLWGLLDLNDNHRLRSIDGSPQPPPLIAEAFGKWLGARTDRDGVGSEPYPVFLVAAEGGGLRAAYFTAAVLNELQTRCAHFAQHTFLISGVSGGSVGAALFVQDLLHREARNAPELPCSTSANAPGDEAAMSPALSALSADLLSPLLFGLLYSDLVQRFLPLPIPFFDRARILENALERAWGNATHGTGMQSNEVSFYAVRQGDAGVVPALMLNTTNVETGHRMIVSHVRFPGGWQKDLPTLFDINPDLDIPLSTAAILSARFPLITPAGTVEPGRGWSPMPSKLRYVDGGYFENSGLATILDVIAAVRQEAARENVRLIIISIETSEAITDYPKTGADESSYPSFKFGELLSPLRAMLHTRQARGELAKLEAARVVERLREGCTNPSDCIEAEMITFAIGGGDVPIPLGWSLSESARRELKRQLGSPRCEGQGDKSNACALFCVLQHLARSEPQSKQSACLPAVAPTNP